MDVRTRKSFLKHYRRLPETIQDKVDARIALFVEHPFEPLLHNHALHGGLHEYRSINITGDYRAVYEVKEGVAYFVAVGTHSELYG